MLRMPEKAKIVWWDLTCIVVEGRADEDRLLEC